MIEDDGEVMLVNSYNIREKLLEQNKMFEFFGEIEEVTQWIILTCVVQWGCVFEG